MLNTFLVVYVCLALPAVLTMNEHPSPQCHPSCPNVCCFRVDYILLPLQPSTHGQSLSGARGGGATPPMIILLGPPPPMHGNVSMFEYPGFASNHSAAESIFYHPLFCPPLNWIVLCLAPPPPPMN